MNLIGHLACAKLRDPAFQLGSMLPDLLGMYTRRPRATHLVKFWQEKTERNEEQEGQAPELQPPPHTAAIIEGIQFHLHVDARFHSAPLFRHHAKDLRKALQRASHEDGMKRFFAAHILLELYYDQFLLQAFPELADQFDALLAEGAGGMLWSFAAPHPDVDGDGLNAFTERMLESRFLQGYLSDEGICYRVNRILQRLGQRALNEPETRTVVSYFENGAASMARELLEFVETMRAPEPAADSPNPRHGAKMPGTEAPPSAGYPGPWPLSGTVEPT
jgi:acyl carrier protein phosphodiesterase